ncbi:aldehyde dehydrogenase family protein [Facilibium subflavum]|uniref:aldehyde dehydrogenase family protein n=1 Tax=Facilibium subflavum TaxID=2219058 RepID=UPI001AADA3E5|nr:aldehyde dehydrogenase family protein [Facilibium subflavum]
MQTKSQQTEKALAIDPHNHPMYLGGEWVYAINTTPVLNPYDQSIIGYVQKATKTDMLNAINLAEHGVKANKAMSSYQRARVLKKVSELLLARLEPIAKIISTEGSKTFKEAQKEVKRAANTIALSAEEATRLQGQTIPFDSFPGSENRFGYYTMEPVGIIGAITPYNDPLNLVCHKVGPAIAGGNAVIVKPSSQTPLSALTLASLFDEAGLPKGILSVITGSASDVGETLVEDNRVRMISFTGGVDTGEKITRMAGLKKLSMELGSNSPVIVCQDCDINSAVEAIVSGAFYAAGQNCIGVQRIYIEKAIYDHVKKQLIEQTQKIKVGNQQDPDVTFGPMITENEANRVMSLVSDAIDKGSSCLTGGTHRGTLFEPTLLENVPQDARLTQEEVFGPVAYLAPFDTLDEAINAANGTEYALHAAIFTKDIQKAFHAIAKLDCGSVIINDSTDYRVDLMPFGGRKKSGLGREGVKFALQEMTEPKLACFNL